MLGWYKAGKNDYQQLQSVYVCSGTLDKIVIFTMYATMDKDKPESGWLPKTIIVQSKC